MLEELRFRTKGRPYPKAWLGYTFRYYENPGLSRFRLGRKALHKLMLEKGLTPDPGSIQIEVFRKVGSIISYGIAMRSKETLNDSEADAIEHKDA